MSWLDRVNEASYTSPTGQRLVFGYEDLAYQFDRQASAYTFPGGTGTLVQDMGKSSRRFPLRIYFWGDNYDLEAAVFEALLVEPGIGQLEHPIYGLRHVVPFGTVSRRDDLKSASNQAIFEVEFYETIRSVYPLSDGDPESDVLSALDLFNAAAASQFADNIESTPVGNLARLKSAFISIKNTVTSGLQAVADTTASVQSTFNTIDASINSGIDLLIARPLDLAFQAILLVQAPARAAADIRARLDAYKDLFTSLTTRGSAATTNEFRTQDLYGTSYVTGSILSTVNTSFKTKPEALEAADEVFAQFDAITAWRDEEFERFGIYDTGAAFQQLQNAVALTAGYLIEISFTLKQERTVVLDRSRTVVDLCAELLGSLDDLDFFIASNDFSGSELIELQKGKSIVYYI